MSVSANVISLFGVSLTPLKKDEFLGSVLRAAKQGTRQICVHLNLHGLAMLYEDEAMAALFRRTNVVKTIDGMAIVFLAKLCGENVTRAHRITSLDYIDELFKAAVRDKLKIFYVGGTGDVIARGLDVFRTKYPGLMIDGANGYFSTQGELTPHERMLADKASDANILIIGMGMPRQERWLCRIEAATSVPVIITIGAMMEYFTETLPMPPRWLGPIGLEWVFRLITAPRRLGHRYLVEPFVLAYRILTKPSPGCEPPK